MWGQVTPDCILVAFYIVILFFYFYQYIYWGIPDVFVLGTYYAAVLENRADFVGRVVVDVGAGSGILSLFAAQVS